jgi:hypothetical protein
MNPRGGANVSAAEITITETEYERVVRWRAEELERAGFAPAAAAELAGRFDVDLHRAVDLLQKGCPPDVALSILR